MAHESDNPASLRVFFAVWPDSRECSVLADWILRLQDRVGGRPVMPDRLHLTLAFIGAALAPQVAALRSCAAGMPPVHAMLQLDRVGFWPRSGITWAGCRAPDPRLIGWVTEFHERLRRLGFRIEEREFRPHITLLRRARRRARLRVEPIDWRIDEFTLVASRSAQGGTRYEVLDRWSGPVDVK